MKKLVLIASFAALLLPAVSLAAIPNWGPIITCSGAPSPDSKLPRCTSLCDALATGKNLVEFGMTLALFIIAPLVFVWGGIQVLISGANPGLRSKGMQTIRGVVIAIIIVVLAYVIVNTFITLLGIATTKNGPRGFIQGFTSPISCEATPAP